jgi:hypothetical protein
VNYNSGLTVGRREKRNSSTSRRSVGAVFINDATPTPGKILSGQANMTEVFRVDGNGDVVANTGDFQAPGAGKGIILKSPDGTACARISLSNAGALVTTTITCP